MSEQLSLSARYYRALSAASSLSSHSALSPEHRQISDSALADLRLVAAAISDLQLFGKNETLEDVSTRQIVYLTVPYATAELLQALPSTEPHLRKDILTQAELEMQKFIIGVIDYEIVDAETAKSIKRSAELGNNPAQRREAKIQQYKMEKQLKSQIQAIRSRSLSNGIEEPANNYDAIRALLAPASNHAGSVNTEDEDDDMDDETLRELSILLIRLLLTQANASLLQISQEIELLRTMPPTTVSAQNPEQTQSNDDTWRLDQVSRGGPDGRGPLMDTKGRPLRPFTIMPASQVVERTRLQQEVFRPDHRLPTMTIDEYLAEEERRGNIISGGGKASAEAPTLSEQLEMHAELDGTVFGEEKSEEKRRKDEEWAVYTDSNPKGLGNTMNRG
ncbi:Type 2A phosphatase-associated protein 42 [Ceratobasidium sp. AG-Ba]|nr:Type 2A phosphatase-associated protein 42 [Ceratobasidium sp. AG-Ba]